MVFVQVLRFVIEIQTALTEEDRSTRGFRQTLTEEDRSTDESLEG